MRISPHSNCYLIDFSGFHLETEYFERSFGVAQMTAPAEPVTTGAVIEKVQNV